jgi:transcription antitermination factor NusG
MHGSETIKRWFAVFTTPRHEKRVEEHCHIRGIESFLPLYPSRRQWKDGSKKTLQLPLFPSYIFVRIGCGERIPVLEVPGVISIVGGSQPSLALSNVYIDALRAGVHQGRIEPHPYLTVGMMVRINSGPMAGAEGILLRTKNNCRVVLTLEMIMRSITVEVEMGDIAPVGRVSCNRQFGLDAHCG